jgi:hypothetical protein
VLIFIAVGVLFWWLGRRTRAQVAVTDGVTDFGPEQPG